MRLPDGGPDIAWVWTRMLARLHPGYRYVEGVAMRTDGIQVPHCWCVDENGTVVDPDPRWDSEATSYYGAVVDLAEDLGFNIFMADLLAPDADSYRQDIADVIEALPVEAAILYRIALQVAFAAIELERRGISVPAPSTSEATMLTCSRYELPVEWVEQGLNCLRDFGLIGNDMTVVHARELADDILFMSMGEDDIVRFTSEPE